MINTRKIFTCLFGITLITIISLSISEYLLKNKININQNNYNIKQLTSLLTDIKYNNNILGSKKIINNYIIYTVSYNNISQAIIVKTNAPDGYNGKIDLLIAIKLGKPSTILGVKILQHNETPGLGDLIEDEKSNWLSLFKHKFITNKKFDPKIDSITGATITSTAVNNAIERTLDFINLYFNHE
jgi:electron transport complex protein RnfG